MCLVWRDPWDQFKSDTRLYFLCFQVSSCVRRGFANAYSHIFKKSFLLTHYTNDIMFYTPTADSRKHRSRASSCVWDGLNFCPISGMLWDGVQVVLSVWLQVPSLRVTSNDVRPLRLSASENKAPEIKRGWETLTVLWPGIRCLQGVWPCVTVVTWRRDKARDTWHSLRSQPAASFLSDLRAHVSVTNLVKKAEAGGGAEFGL